mgnify:CR=1 FL=1
MQLCKTLKIGLSFVLECFMYNSFNIFMIN